MEIDSYIFSLLDDLTKLSRLLAQVKLPQVWHGELTMLQYLYQHRDMIVLPVNLKQALQLTGPRVSILMNGLEEKGYIRRQMARGDRRKVWVSITPEGERYYAGQMEEVTRLIRPLLSSLGIEDTKELARITAKLLHTLEAIAAAPADPQ